MKRVSKFFHKEKNYQKRVTSNTVKKLNSNEMKTSKMNSIKMLLIVAFVTFSFTNACAQPCNSNTTKSGNNATAKSKVETPSIDLQSAILANNLEIVKQHIEAGTDLNEKETMSGSTPLITASTFGRTEIAKVLIDANAALDMKNNEGSTALHAAAFFCHIEIVQLLIDAGADKNLRNNHGATPRQSVTVPFADMKPIYGIIQQQLEPLGLKLDMQELEITRPVIAMMLQ
jgi:hypothetical protein